LPAEAAAVSSIYRRALGPDFDRLHPMIQRRFGFSSADGVASIGTGVMEELWRGRAYTLPFLRIGTWRNIMFPDRARDVAFTVENYAYVDRFGRETVTWIRTFQFRERPRRFDASMIYSEQRGRIVDYLGNRQHLAVDIDVTVDEARGLRLRSGEQRFHEGPIAFRFPMALSGFADVREWYADEEQRYRIDVSVTNPRWGPLFGYRGWFTVEERPVAPADVPRHVRPLREERRE
jgi:Domain of unknown function (DUF4166)